jgi:hypothetical protein
MRKILFFIFLAIPQFLLAQIPGSKWDGPLITKYGTFHKGDTLKVGTGSDPNGDFKFIYQPANDLLGTDQTNLQKMYSSTRLIIKYFKEWESHKFGLKEFTVVGFSSRNGVVELEAAIEAGEIIVPNFKPKQLNQALQFSVADELIKLKKLLDDGVLTKDEYESQKKKLLEN